jgi:hypothetical protein
MTQQGAGAWFMNAYLAFHKRHESVKNYVHNGFRYPLPPWGRTLMGFVYFSLPVIGGYHVMQWAISKSHEEIGERGTSQLFLGEAYAVNNKKNRIESSIGPLVSHLCLAHFPFFSFVSGEKLRNKQIEGIGDKVMIDNATGVTKKKVGAGGWGGGVNLAVSNETIQEKNQRMLKKFLKKQRKLLKKKKEEMEAAKKSE